MVIPLRDRTAPSVYSALDRCLRLIGGAPTYALTDNERMVTTEHIAGVPVRNRAILEFAKHYSVTVLTCQPADPASKGGVEAAVKLAKDDLVPKSTNLLPEYGAFAELETACRDFMTMINAKEHRIIRRWPADALLDEQAQLHRVPEEPHTVAFGLSRTVPVNTPMVTFENGQYSVPAHLIGEKVFVRSHGAGQDAQVIIVHVGRGGPVEVARHGKTMPGRPAIIDAHFPHRPSESKIPGEYTPRPRTIIETEFFAIGDGAKSWLLEAAASGAERLVPKMTDAIALAKIAGTAAVDRALGVAAIHGRFGANDLLSLVAAGSYDQEVHAADEAKSLPQGTSAWHRLNTRTEGNK